MFALLFISTTSAWATSASLSTNTINISQGETGSFSRTLVNNGAQSLSFDLGESLPAWLTAFPASGIAQIIVLF